MTSLSFSGVAILGAGPSGLIAAEVLAAAGVSVIVFDHKPTPARKLLMAGRGGLNITHSEDRPLFLSRYGEAASFMTPMIESFPPDALRHWCSTLGQTTFVGTSGRVFPEGFKASPLLRSWLKRLESLGVEFRMNRHWTGWNKLGRLTFSRPDGQEETLRPAATILALGGASWPKLGSDATWVPFVKDLGIQIAPFRPSNCGFTCQWSDVFRDKFSGSPLKPIHLSYKEHHITGEVMITRTGIEGSGIYALSRFLRAGIDRDGSATLHLDLRPGLSLSELTHRLQAPRARMSFSNFMRKHSGLPPAAIGLLREGGHKEDITTSSAHHLATLIKNYPLILTAPAGIERAISSAGGILRDELDDGLMLRKKPGVWAIGEMIDWEAPTGGYLLQGAFSSGVWAADAVLKYLRK